MDRTPSTWVQASAAAYRKYPKLFSLAYLSTRHEKEVADDDFHKRFLLCEKEKPGQIAILSNIALYYISCNRTNLN